MTDHNGTTLKVGQRLRVVAHRNASMIGREGTVMDLGPSPYGDVVRIDNGGWGAWLMPTEVVVIEEVKDED